MPLKFNIYVTSSQPLKNKQLWVFYKKRLTSVSSLTCMKVQQAPSNSVSVLLIIRKSNKGRLLKKANTMLGSNKLPFNMLHWYLIRFQPFLKTATQAFYIIAFYPWIKFHKIPLHLLFNRQWNWTTLTPGIVTFYSLIPILEGSSTEERETLWSMESLW